MAEDFQLNLRITGMSCGACSARVQDLLSKQPHVSQPNVNLAAESATLCLQHGQPLRPIVDAIEKEGFAVEQQQITFTVEGMSCAACSSSVERMFYAQPGVIDAQVNLATETAQVQVTTGSTNAHKLAKALTAAGYPSSAKQPQTTLNNRREAEAKTLYRRLLIAALLAFPVFILAMGSHLIPSIAAWIETTLGTQNSFYIQFILTTLIMLGPGLSFYKKGFANLWRRNPDMNSLVAIGTSAAWLLSSIATFFPNILIHAEHSIYFEAAAVIVPLILLGRYLEAHAKGRTGDAIRQLLKLQTNTATVQLKNGEFAEQSIEQITVGDVLMVRPGERFSADGTVVTGRSWVDESMISGEPLPIEKEPGDSVTGGTINRNGNLTFRATRVGSDTLLAHIISLVEQAQGARLPVQDLVDRITRWFVPVVIGLALLAVLIWLLVGPAPVIQHALIAGVTVLIIACPCAMGLATPTSIMVGTGRAASLGVLFRRGDALQRLHQSTLIAFDKTGTLTEGQPKLIETKCINADERDILRLVASAESLSEHPIAGAIVAAARKRNIVLSVATDFLALPGFGLQAKVEGTALIVGTDRLMAQSGIDTSPLKKTVASWAEKGYTPLYVAGDGHLKAAIAVADPLKKSSKTAIRTLLKQGLRVALISGDSRATSEAIASRLGIDTVIAEVLPDGKVEALKKLRGDNTILAFVGDGINDAPALASADVGIALGTGTDVAIESADVVLMSGDLNGVVNAFEISRRTLQNIHQNLFWAFAYNVFLIPVAAGVLYPINGTVLSPVLAAAAMALSSVFVLLNALRLHNVQTHFKHSLKTTGVS